MNRVLKLTTGLSIVMLIAGCSTGQESLKVLNESWSKLEAALKHRANLAITLMPDTIKSESSAKATIERIKAGVAEFNRFIDSTNILDSSTVKLTGRKAVESLGWMQQFLNLLMDHPGRPELAFRNLQSELEGAELRVSRARKEFNQLCIQHNRNDLLFDETWKSR